MSIPAFMSHKVACLVPSCGKRISRNRSGNYSGHKWANMQITCPAGGTVALELGDRVSLNLGNHAAYGIITWLGWDPTGPRPGALAKIDVSGEEITRRTVLLVRVP